MIIAFCESKKTEGLTDYKFHCFGGEPKFILVCGNRFSESGLEENFYSTEWKLLDVKRPNTKRLKTEPQKPTTFDEMMKLSRVLSKDLPFLRVDFYDICGKTYFGELTFFPASGFKPYVPEKWDYILGSWLTLSECKD